MEFLGIDFEYTINYWKKALGLKKPPANVEPKENKVTPPPETIVVPKDTTVEKIVKKTTGFNISEIMTDEEFCDCDSMDENQIQEFLVSKKGVILTDYKIDGHLVSYWINKHCNEHGLNPKVILTHLQKEMGAVTRKKPFRKQHRYDYIMGVGAYDGKWSEKWKGMDKQILGGVKVCKKWYDRGEKNNTYPMKFKAGDRKDLIVNNSATYSLYKYTPWVGDKDKKIKTPKGYHTYKSAFGIFLFWKVYRNFFKK